MKVTIQTGIDAGAFQQLMYQMAQAGMDCDAKAARIKREEIAKLMPRQVAQGSLFEDDMERGRR